MNPLSRHAFLFALLIAFVVVAFSPQRNGSAHSTPTPEPVAEVAKETPKSSVVAGFDFSNLDKTANACQDFNQFANGGWMAKNPIPPEYSVWGNFTKLDEENNKVLHDILEGLLRKKKLTANEQKVADYYGSSWTRPPSKHRVRSR